MSVSNIREIIISINIQQSVYCNPKHSARPLQASKCFANLGKQQHTKDTNLYTNEKR